MAWLRARIPAEHPSAAILGEERIGGGVVVAPHVVLTVGYLVLGAREVEVLGFDGKPRSVRRLHVDHETGLAVLLLDGGALPPAPLSPGTVHPGQPVFLLACTDEQERKGATGHVSVVGPFEAFWEYALDRAIMTTIVNPGMAGAPLLDGRGHVLGVVSLGLTAVARYSLAVPVDLYLRDRERLESEDPLAGRRRRAWLGVYPQAHSNGVVVSGVVPQGPADKAGLLRGDLVLSLEGRPLESVRTFYDAIWRRGPGERLGLQVLRDDAIRVVDVVAEDRYEFFR